MLRRLVLPALFVSTLLVLGGGGSRAQEDPLPVSPLDQVYALVVDDRIEVYVEGHGELQRPYVVPASGVVSFPPIGRVRLLGRSQEELAEEIKSRLVAKGHLTDPTVYVLITEHAPRQAFLFGATTRTVKLPIHTRYGIVEILSLAGVKAFGGGAGAADFQNVTISRRRENGDPFRFTVNVDDIVVRGDFRKNVVIMPNDIVYIPVLASEESSAAVYILGKVGKPGRYPFQAGRMQMTLTKLIALAGDFHQFADEGSIKILRKQGNRTVGFEIDFDEIIDLEIQDFVLQPDDLVYVPESPI